ncbi:hypothetical protein EDB84DRAFT_1572793 [Lactarius hengduanensis]|nr:hypothetical protein EDB84DRAFT_1572793 [Lactarius hengduanensis]
MVIITPSSSSHPSSGDRHQPHVGTEELNGLSVLLPRKRKGRRLFLAPKPVERHLVVAARPAEPTRGGVASDPAGVDFHCRGLPHYDTNDDITAADATSFDFR